MCIRFLQIHQLPSIALWTSWDQTPGARVHASCSVQCSECYRHDTAALRLVFVKRAPTKEGPVQWDERAVACVVEEFIYLSSSLHCQLDKDNLRCLVYKEAPHSNAEFTSLHCKGVPLQIHICLPWALVVQNGGLRRHALIQNMKNVLASAQFLPIFFIPSLTNPSLPTFRKPVRSMVPVAIQHTQGTYSCRLACPTS